eukprot:Hpha_TRINITY_DN16504_c3_g2::TRINITY_DN16504_c3_g2_i1::g.135082::m.135082
MLNKPESVRSTFWEGYNADGTFNFQGIYMSNAHGWASGPAAALTFGTLGIRRAPAGEVATFAVAPQFGGLEHCEGRLHFAPDAYVEAAWNVSSKGVLLGVDSTTMGAATGTVTLDLAGLVGTHPHSPRTALAAVGINDVVVWRREEGTLCAAGDLCSISGVGEIGIRGVTDSAPSGVVKILGVDSQRTLTLRLSFG